MKAAYRFQVDLYSSSAAATAASSSTEDLPDSFEYEFDENGELVGGPHTLFLPLVTR